MEKDTLHYIYGGRREKEWKKEKWYLQRIDEMQAVVQLIRDSEQSGLGDLTVGIHQVTLPVACMDSRRRGIKTTDN